MQDYVEVIYSPASNSKTILIKVAFSKDMTVKDAIQISGLLDSHPEIAELDVGIFRKITNPMQKVSKGERIEIYRDLKISPMEKRRMKAK